MRKELSVKWLFPIIKLATKIILNCMVKRVIYLVVINMALITMKIIEETAAAGCDLFSNKGEENE